MHLRAGRSRRDLQRGGACSHSAVLAKGDSVSKLLLSANPKVRCFFLSSPVKNSFTVMDPIYCNRFMHIEYVLRPGTDHRRTSRRRYDRLSSAMPQDSCTSSSPHLSRRHRSPRFRVLSQAQLETHS